MDRVEPLPLAAVGRQRQQQPLGVGVVVREEHGAQVGLFHDRPGVHHLHVIGRVRDDAEVVGDEDDRGAELFLQGLDDRQDLRLHGDIERGRRLVGDQQLGVERHRHRDHGPLPHAAGELVRVVVHPAVRLRDPDQLEQLDGPGPGLRLGHVVVVLADHLHDLPADLVVRVKARQRVLEDHADLGPADLAHLTLAEREQVPALEHRPAGDPRRAGEAHDRLCRHALAGA